ncbi:MAG: hypothetical protein K2Y33_04860, partial [Mycolicibacterium frederiksbergense]|nr:hypothetical protein [Mycolicibacterium frederiksbergense]
RGCGCASTAHRGHPPLYARRALGRRLWSLVVLVVEQVLVTGVGSGTSSRTTIAPSRSTAVRISAFPRHAR